MLCKLSAMHTGNFKGGFPRWLRGKRMCLPMQEMKEHEFNPWVGRSPEEEMATHSNVCTNSTAFHKT